MPGSFPSAEPPASEARTESQVCQHIVPPISGAPLRSVMRPGEARNEQGMVGGERQNARSRPVYGSAEAESKQSVRARLAILDLSHPRPETNQIRRTCVDCSRYIEGPFAIRSPPGGLALSAVLVMPQGDIICQGSCQKRPGRGGPFEHAPRDSSVHS